MVSRKRDRSWRAALLVGVLAVDGASAQETKRSGRFVEINPEVRYSVSRALNYLVRHQNRSDSFRLDRFPVAENALAGLAFLAGGFTETGGDKKFSDGIRKCTTTLLSLQNPMGYFYDKHSRMYGHGFATLFLAELYGMCGDRDAKIREALKRAIRVIEKSQIAEGGWDYDPAARFGGKQKNFVISDTSITVCQTMALRAARNLGVRVDPLVISRARRYIARAQNPDGGFSYRTSGRYGHGESAFPRSAAGVCILYSLGDYSSNAMKNGIRYLEKNYTELSNPFAYYAQYYCSQAMFQVGGRRWREYYPWIRGVLAKEQEDDGSWKSGALAGFGLVSMEPSKVQTTSMALIVLQLPYRYLPIHER
ncbi:MAG: terpene cyclase/mutase family protein [Planctomycetota bacterium]|nr:terpene cyclase/mutase family protein [Planctomycetota bacterium]